LSCAVSDQPIWQGQEDGGGHHLGFLKVQESRYGCHDSKVDTVEYLFEDII
jgi:hypothetical protein